MVLSALPGVGERLAQKMTDHFGSEADVIKSLKSGDISQIAEIDGVSPKRALAIARSIAGDDGQFLATKEAVKLHQKLIDKTSIKESLISFKRAGASSIVTYFADQIDL